MFHTLTAAEQQNNRAFLIPSGTPQAETVNMYVTLFPWYTFYFDIDGRKLPRTNKKWVEPS